MYYIKTKVVVLDIHVLTERWIYSCCSPSFKEIHNSCILFVSIIESIRTEDMDTPIYVYRLYVEAKGSTVFIIPENVYKI